jgi:hypothetical protein
VKPASALSAIPAAAPGGTPAEQIRALIDAGFAGVEKARQMRLVGSSVASAEAVEDVRKVVVRVRTLLARANYSESQLGIVHKKIQALKDAAERVGGAST